MFNKLVNRFSPLASLYNRAVVAKSAAATEYYYDAHQTQQAQKPFQYDLQAATDQDHLIITDTTKQTASGDKMKQEEDDDDFCVVDYGFEEEEDDDFCVVGAAASEESSANDNAAAGNVTTGNSNAGTTDTIPSVDNGLPTSSSSASNLVNYAYHAASVVAENTSRTAICGAVRSCNFVWSEKKHIEEFVQEKTKKYTQPKMRGFGVDFANNPSLKFNLGAASLATAAA